MKTQYLPASYRGAAFLVESTSDEGGPRSIIHEFPGRKFAFAEPSGRYPTRFTIEAHLIGPDFEQQLLALDAALSQDGPGKLIHPHRGDKLVVVDGPYRVQRNTRELGMVRVSVVFCEAGDVKEPTVRLNTSAGLTASVAKAFKRTQQTKLSVDGPDFLASAARAVLAGPKGALTLLSKINNRVHAAFGLIDDVSNTITALSNEVTTLLQTPETLAIHLQGLFNSVLFATTAALGNLNRGDLQRNRARVATVMGYASALGAFGDTLAAVPVTTSTRQTQADNQAAIVDLVESAAVLSAVSALTEIPLDNTDQAGEAFAVIRDLFDRLLDRGTLDSGATQSLHDVRAALHAHLRGTVADLPELGRYTPPVTVPAVVLAYRLYGDSTRDIDIIERNPSIEHPGFLAGGVELSVAEV